MASGWTDEEYALRFGISIERVREMRRELHENTPRAQKARAEVAAAFQEAAEGGYTDKACAKLREILAPPPLVKPETVDRVLWDIRLMRRAKAMGG